MLTIIIDQQKEAAAVNGCVAGCLCASCTYVALTVSCSVLLDDVRLHVSTSTLHFGEHPACRRQYHYYTLVQYQ